MTWCFIEYISKANWVYLTFWWYLVVHVCVYGACMHIYVSSFVLYDFIMDSMKSNTILLKPKWFYEISNDFMKSNWNLQRVTRFHKINRSLQDFMKFIRISLKSTEFYRISLNPTGFYKFSWNPTQVHMKSIRFYDIYFMIYFIKSKRISHNMKSNTILLKAIGYH